MNRETREGIANLESTVEASDLATAPEGVKAFVDVIGDENLAPVRTPRTETEES
jgi:hypothetical protein